MLPYTLSEIADAARELDGQGHHIVADVFDVIFACVAQQEGVRTAIYDPFAVLRVQYNATPPEIEAAFDAAIQQANSTHTSPASQSHIQKILTWAKDEVAKSGAAYYWKKMGLGPIDTTADPNPQVTWTGNAAQQPKQNWRGNLKNWWQNSINHAPLSQATP